jgi:hypothetical protein
MIERGCCFSIKKFELYVIKKIVETELKICRDEEHKLDREKNGENRRLYENLRA